MTKEHYENNPNDHELTPFENKLMGKIGKLRHSRKVNGILNSIRIRVLKTQIKSDQQIKNTFIEMFPNEYKKALKESINRYGATKRLEHRRMEILKSMNIKQPNILKKEIQRWKSI